MIKRLQDGQDILMNQFRFSRCATHASVPHLKY